MTIISPAIGQNAPRNAGFQTGVEQAVSWLPADTETLLVANQKFSIPSFSDDAGQRLRNAPAIQSFDFQAIWLFGIGKGALQTSLAGDSVLFAIEGARHFRFPSGLGGAMFEGCQIAVMEKARADRGQAFLNRARNEIVRVEMVAGQSIPILSEELESDLWTIYVAFPRPNVVMACTNRDYLQETLQRISGRSSARALPASLPEWKGVDKSAPFWAIRHFDRSQTQFDPSSPLHEDSQFGPTDASAVGIAVAFKTAPKNVATLSYFSAMPDLLNVMQKESILNMQIAGMFDKPVGSSIHFSQTAPGAIEVQYELGPSLPADGFVFILMALFGHVVAV